MSEKFQSAVEWLYQKMYINKGRISIEELDKAMAMEKNQNSISNNSRLVVE